MVSVTMKWKGFVRKLSWPGICLQGPRKTTKTTVEVAVTWIQVESVTATISRSASSVFGLDVAGSGNLGHILCWLINYPWILSTEVLPRNCGSETTPPEARPRRGMRPPNKLVQVATFPVFISKVAWVPFPAIHHLSWLWFIPTSLGHSSLRDNDLN
jgi:hypothetical protein